MTAGRRDVLDWKPEVPVLLMISGLVTDQNPTRMGGFRFLRHRDEFVLRATETALAETVRVPSVESIELVGRIQSSDSSRWFESLSAPARARPASRYRLPRECETHRYASYALRNIGGLAVRMLCR